MSLDVKKIWTGSVTAGTLTLDATYGFTIISLVLQSGTGTVQGNLLAINGVASTPIPLTIGQAITIDTGSASSIQDYLNIVTTGTVLILAR
jgi:hypothetical protein